MSTRLADLVERLGGHLKGDGSICVAGIAPLADATPSQISFLSNAKFRAQATSCHAAALILAPADDAAIGPVYTGARIVTDNPYAYFARAAQLFAALSAPPRRPGIHPHASIDPAASIAPTAVIGAHVTVEADAVIEDGAVIDAGCFVGQGARIGAGTHLHPNVTFESACRIGRNGIVHAGAVIGADGFGFANEGGAWIKIPQTGGVSIGDDVEIGANTCIDRGALTDTVIEDGVKLDNLIQIGHNVRVGRHTAMAGCVGVAGSATIGAHCTVGGGAIILGHLTIGPDVNISAGTLVSKSILKPGHYTGIFPVDDNATWERNAASLKQLHSLRNRIKTLEQEIKK